MSRHVFRAQEYIEHMLEACTRISKYIAGKSAEDFSTSTLLQDAVTRNLEILGEASKQLRDVLPDAQERFPALPFQTLYGLRNRMIHAYALTNYNVIFELATQDVPGLTLALNKVLASWPKDLKSPPDVS
jgi:uncharacterized protein with HEPN domain